MTDLKQKVSTGNGAPSLLAKDEGMRDEQKLTRRRFLKNSAILSAGAALGLSLEERALLAARSQKPTPGPPDTSPRGVPTGQIGNLRFSRIICGGNLISGFAHSRDLIYVSSLLKHYFTDDKVCKTLEVCEESGINTAILRLDEHTLRILKTYWNDRGGEIQWIAQIKQWNDADLARDINKAIDNGAVGAYVQGGVADDAVKKGQVELIGKALEVIKKQGVIAGIGAHALETVAACEKAGLSPDFYMKTLHSRNYWSAGIMPRNDSCWAETPEQTIEFMKTVNRPWIAFKVLAAGAERSIQS